MDEKKLLEILTTRFGFIPECGITPVQAESVVGIGEKAIREKIKQGYLFALNFGTDKKPRYKIPVKSLAEAITKGFVQNGKAAIK